MRAHAGLREAFPTRQRPHRIDAILQFTTIQQRLIDADISTRRHVLDAGHADACGVIGGRAGGGEFLFEAWRWENLPDKTLRGVFQDPGGLAGFRIPNDDPAGRVQRLPGHVGEFERQAVCQSHVTVQPIHEDRSIRREPINQFLSRQLRIRPALVIPVTTGDPAPGRQLVGEGADSFGKLLLRTRVAQIDTRQLKTAGHEMHVRIVESRQHELAFCIDHARVCAHESPDFFRRSHGDDAIARDGDSLGERLVLIHRVNRRVDDD